MTETKVPKPISRYFAELARKANAKMVRGSEEAKARTAKAREARKRKAEERKAVRREIILCASKNTRSNGRRNTRADGKR